MDDQIFDDKTRQDLPIFNRPEPAWKKYFSNKPVIFSTLAAILAIGLIGWYFLFSGNGLVQPTSQNVTLVITGPDQLVSGNEAEYHVIYRNAENADMVNVSLEMFYPNGFKFKSATPTSTSSSGQAFNLPILKQGQEKEIIIRGKLSGGTGEDKTLKAVLHYRLSNFNSEFVVENTIHTGILPPNLTMDILGPVDVVNGQDATFTLAFTNVSGQNFDNLAVQMSYPTGFSFTSAQPAATKNNNYWLLNSLPMNSSVNIEITGSFVGDDAEQKLVRADLGQIINNVFAPQMTSTATFRIIPSSLGLTITSDAKDGIVKLGDTINYKVKYVNQGPIGLNNLVVTVNLEGTALDLPKLSAQGAIVTGKTLVWKAATLSNLTLVSPSEKGEINFSVPLVQNLNTNLKNQLIKVTATISSDEVTKPTKAQSVDLKLSSQLSLIVSGDYVSGTVPMQVGKTTVFAMTFLLSNFSNDLSNTSVTANLPLPSSTWKNVVIPDSEKNRLSFDPNSGKITWNIGDLAAFTGKFIPVLRVSFQLAVTPTDNNRGKDVELLSNIRATGTDTFTGHTIQSETINIVSTNTIDDDVMNSKGTTVQ